METKIYTDKLLIKIIYLTKAIIEENRKQIDKWGIQKHTLFVWQTALTEEVGELAEAILKNHFDKESLSNIFKEAIQTATLALKIAEMTGQKELDKILLDMLEKKSQQQKKE